MKRRDFLRSGLLSLASGKRMANVFGRREPPSPKSDFYVAPGGDDSNHGTATAPFATLYKARDVVRKLISAGLTGDVRVLIRSGTYQLNETLKFGPEDSGTEKYSITYAALPGEKVVLSGGRRIRGWSKGPKAIWTTEVPEVKAGQLYFRQLFVNGNRAIRARTPNANDKTPWWNIKTSTAKTDSLPSEDALIPITLTGQVKSYNHPGDVELVYIFNNEEGRKRLGAIDEKDQTLSLAPPNRWNSRLFVADWPLSLPAAGKACYLENALEMLDEPGEWYLDRQTGVLSYWPREGEDLQTDEVIAPALQNTILAVVGTCNRPVINLHFEGIHAQYVDWPLPPWGYMPLFCCNLQSGPDSHPGHRPIDAAVEYEHARSCNFTNGGIAHVGGMGVCLRSGTANNRIEGNEIADIAGGGVIAGYANVAAGYLYALPPPQDGEYRGYRVANNYIHHCGTDYYGAVGILLYAAQDAVVSHNLIHDTAYLGMGVAGSQDPRVPFARNNLVEYNHIFDAMKVTVDGGGMYVTFPQLGRGATVRGNLIHDTQGCPFARMDAHFGEHPPSAGLYLDGNSSGVHYEKNVLYRNPAAGPLIFDYENASGKNTWLDNLFQKDGTPPEQFIEVMQAYAGLEPQYQRSILRREPNLCQYSELVDSAQEGWAAYQFELTNRGHGVVEIIRRPEPQTDVANFKLRGLDVAACYEIKAYGGTLIQSKVWGPDSMSMLSNVLPLPLPTIGLVFEQDNNQISGRNLLDQGLAVKLTKTPEFLWITYRRVNHIA